MVKILSVKSKCEKCVQAGEGHHPLSQSRTRLILALLKKFRLCGHPDPEIRGGGGAISKKFFLAFQPSVGLDPPLLGAIPV